MGPFSLLNLPLHHSRPSKGKNMPVLNHPNLQPARIQQRRKNVRKHKSEQEMIDDELELLTTKNGILKDKLTEMETEFRYLKKLMTEAGLGRYAQTVHL